MYKYYYYYCYSLPLPISICGETNNPGLQYPRPAKHQREISGIWLAVAEEVSNKYMGVIQLYLDKS